MTRLRILWLSHFVPYPPKGGCFQRSYNLIARAGTTCDIHLIAMKPKASTHPAAEMAGAREALLAHCRSVEIVDISAATQPLNLAMRVAASIATGQPVTVTLFRSAEVHARVRERLAAGIDVLHLDSISLAEYLPDAGPVPTLMTHHGAESYMIHRRIAKERSLVRKAFFGIEGRTLEACERRVCPQVGMNVVMSELDRDLMAQVAPAARYAVVENGVDVDLFAAQPVADGHSLVFAGRLDQYSNRDAILHFMDAVWPRIVAAWPDATIRIIGLNPPERLRTLAAADRRVEVLGFVDDIRPHFAASTAMICPIRDGGGTRIKILDALAQAKPIVSTSIGCEGIKVTPEQDVLIADDPDTFARQVGRVFEDAGLRASLARNARRVAEEVYAWPRLGARLTALYEQLAQREIPAATGTDGR